MDFLTALGLVTAACTTVAFLPPVIKNWLPAWRNWLRRERVPQTAARDRTATPAPRRSPTPDPRLEPLPAFVQAALAASEQRRIAQLLAAGIDPATGLQQPVGDLSSRRATGTGPTRAASRPMPRRPVAAAAGRLRPAAARPSATPRRPAGRRSGK